MDDKPKWLLSIKNDLFERVATRHGYFFIWFQAIDGVPAGYWRQTAVYANEQLNRCQSKKNARCFNSLVEVKDWLAEFRSYEYPCKVIAYTPDGERMTRKQTYKLYQKQAKWAGIELNIF